MFDLTPSFYSIKAFNNVTPLVRLWSLRALVLAGGYRKFALASNFSDADVAEALGFESGSIEGAYSRAAVLQQLQDMLAAAERSAADCVPPEILCRNLACLADLVGLNELECRILCLVTYVLRDRFLQTVTDMLGDMTFNQIFDSFAAILAVPADDIRAALAPKATLIRSGIVQLDSGFVSLMRSKIDVLSDSLVDAIHSFELDTDALLKGIASRCLAPVLTLKDYTSVRDTVEMIQLLLESRVAERSAGTNILVYGTPGTGKSQLVRVIAQQLNLPLFEVASQNAAGNPVDGERRLRALSAAQCILNRQPALLLFDEVEDAFRSPDLGAAARGLGQKCKAWMNNMLETNPVPTFWVSNSVDCLDPAFIRRFDIVLELSNPSAEQTNLKFGGLPYPSEPDWRHPSITTDARHEPTPSRTARNRLRSIAADSVPDPHQPLGLVGRHPGR